MDQNISRFNIQLAPLLHADLETFLYAQLLGYAAVQGHDSPLKISSDDKSVLWRGSQTFITFIALEQLWSQGSEGSKAMQYIFSVCQVNRDYRLKMLVEVPVPFFLPITDPACVLWPMRRPAMNLRLSFYQRSQPRYYYRSDYKLRHKMYLTHLTPSSVPIKRLPGEGRDQFISPDFLKQKIAKPLFPCCLRCGDCAWTGDVEETQTHT